jgi:DNA-binding transcriptional LysR family regulator
VRGDGAELRGTVRVVAPVALGQTLLVPIVARLRERHPGLGVHWTVTDRRVRLAEAGADCLIRAGEIEDPGAVVQPVCEVRRVVVAAPRVLEAGRLVDPADLSRVPVVAVEPFYVRALRLYGAPEGPHAGAQTEVPVAPVFRTDNMLAARLAVLEGVGAAVLPTSFVADEVARGALRRVLPAWEAERLTIRVAWPAGRHRARTTAALVDAVRRELPSRPGMYPVPSSDPEKRSSGYST